uniref:Gag/pol polyprotein n=1 Tax=Solanum tuberosum TaxID=4113 RepID=M1DET8_SOLTU
MNKQSMKEEIMKAMKELHYTPDMIATVMLRIGFEHGFGLGKYLQGITEPIQIFTTGSKFGLGYIPIVDDEMEASSNKVVDWELAKPVPHLYQSFPMREYVNDDGLGEGIRNIFEEYDVVLEEMIETSGI